MEQSENQKRINAIEIILNSFVEFGDDQEDAREAHLRTKFEQFPFVKTYFDFKREEKRFLKEILTSLHTLQAVPAGKFNRIVESVVC